MKKYWYSEELECGWYHDATDTLDGFQVKYFPGKPEEKDRVFENGPFKTFGEAKKAGIEFYKDQIDAYKNAIKLAKSLRKPK